MFKRTSPGSPVPLDPNQQQLLGLNLDFLQVLLIAQHTDPATTPGNARPGLRLAETQASVLANCDTAALQRMAACGFSLYSLNLHRVDEWLHLAEHSAQVIAPGSADGSADSSTEPAAADALTVQVQNFMHCAVFFAWHLAQQDLQAARLLLGMSAETASVLRNFDLRQCRHVAQRYTRLLTPRWQHNREHFKFAQLLGTQLVAQDLEPSAIARLTTIDPD
jgi:hypothetical protein